MKVLVIGGTGQIGFYLCKELVKKKNQIFVTTRNTNLKKSKLFKNFFGKKIKILNFNIKDEKNVKKKILKIKPSIIYYLAGQSSVQKSFTNKKETLESNYIGCKNILNFLKNFHLNCKFINFTSSEIFQSSKKKNSIYSKKNPVSPYGLAKFKSYQITKQYREKGVQSYNAILFNCESEIRPKNFVLPKICLAAIAAEKLFKSSKVSKFNFGNIKIIRDWGWAEEYVKIILEYTNLRPQDFVVASGKSFSIESLLNEAFKFFSLNWKDYVTYNSAFLRKGEAKYRYASIKKMKKDIGYTPKINGKEIIHKLINHYQKC